MIAAAVAAPAAEVIKYILMFVVAIVVIVLLYKMLSSEGFGSKSSDAGWFTSKWKRV